MSISTALNHGSRSGLKRRAHAVRGIRTRALSAAAHILATNGVEELNLRAIAEYAEIGLASIYHYFDGKEALLVSLARSGFEDLRSAMLDGQGDPTAESPIHATALKFFEFAEHQSQLFSLMFNSRMLARYEELRAAEHRTFLVYEQAVLADVRVPAEHRDNAAYALWALGRGMAAMISSHPGGRLPSELFDKLYNGASFLIDH